MNIQQIHEQIDNLSEKSKENGVDLTNCEEILHEVESDTLELFDTTTGCVTERVKKVTRNMEPLRAKFTDMKNVLSEFMNATAQCVSDPKTSVIRNLACLTDVSIVI